MQTIYLDISNLGVVPTIYAKQGDVGRKFLVVLTDAGIPYAPSAGSVFSVWYSGASGEGNYTEIGDHSAFSVSGNEVTVEMITQMLNKPGDGIICLALNSANGEQIGLWNIPYICERIPGAGSEAAEQYFTAFSEAVANIKDGKSAYEYAQDGGFEGTEEEFAEKMASSSGSTYPSVLDYGAKGDGSTDDTVAFQTALAENRVVFVPGGTYKLNGTLVIRENCCLELSQDTILDFANTGGNCIEMRGSATLRGNHGNINVYHPFAGNVISVDTSKDGVVHGSIEPYYNWTPMWQRQRFIHDVNITRTEGGFRGSLTGAYSGTALYISANYDTTEEYNGSSTAPITIIWGMTVSGLRIGGAFEYGINIENRDKTESGYGNSADPAWNHDMRIEAVLVACATGVRVFNCNTAHLDVTIEPGQSINKVNGEYVKYAKNGIILEHSNHIDLTQSLVWDWNSNGTLVDEDERNAHIALIGTCRGVILSDFLYHEHPSTDIRKLIYTDTKSNFDSLIILQEPFTRWFKPINGAPYFSDGNEEKKIALEEDIKRYFNTDSVAMYEDALSKAIDTDGSIYNGIGYKKGGHVTASGGLVTEDPYTVYAHTGFIKCKSGDVIHIKGIDLSTNDTNCRIAKYDANFEFISTTSIAVSSVISSSSYYHYTTEYDEENDEYKITLVGAADTEYIRFSVYTRTLSEKPIVAVNADIRYEEYGFLADGIKVKGENVVGNPTLTSPNGTKYILSVADDGTISAQKVT